MYTLHIANKNYSSWSLRPWLLLKGLGIDFNEQLHRFPEDRSSWARFRQFSPSGRVPTLVDGGIVVWDSLAIAEYVAEDHPQVWPSERKARAFARSAAAEMHSGFSSLRNICSMNCGLRIKLPSVPPELQADLDRTGEIWAQGLERFGGPFLAGDQFTAADAFFGPVAFRAQTYGLSFGAVGDAYVQQLLALPAMRAWYEAGIAETFREPHHEADAKAAGEWLQDLRAKA